MFMAIDPRVHLGPVCLKVKDFGVSIAFYEKIIGLRTIRREGNTAVLSADGKDPLLYLEELKNGEKKPARTTGLYHFALLLPGRNHLGAALAHLLAAGYPLTGASDHLFSEAIYLSDPDGNGIEIYADRPRDTWQRDEEGYILSATLPLDAKSVLSEGKGTPWTGMPEGTKMGHIHLHVADLEAAEHFYAGILGFEIQFSPQMKAMFQGQFVSAGGYHHHIGFNLWMGKGAKQPPENSFGLKHYTIRYPDADSCHHALRALAGEGIEAEPVPGGHLVRDPSGIPILLTHA
ncbi:MAG: glyoxalase [Caldibacillus debilis]|nr:MAG: glyoxalase [Caldibacillus debilis]